MAVRSDQISFSSSVNSSVALMPTLKLQCNPTTSDIFLNNPRCPVLQPSGTSECSDLILRCLPPSFGSICHMVREKCQLNNFNMTNKSVILDKGMKRF